jgi:hypothetical protein
MSASDVIIVISHSGGAAGFAEQIHDEVKLSA